MLSLVALTSAALAGETLREINWSKAKPAAGVIIEPNAEYKFVQLKIHNTQKEKQTFAILTINDPCITAANYAITGQIRYENVEGTGYLEMWNHFPDGNSYFSRTLDNSGPMRSLSGSSKWRSYILPFYIGNNTKMRPTKLELNVVLAGRGTVYLGPLKLVQSEKGLFTEAATGAWWSQRIAGLVGGITGSVVGVAGGIIGILSGIGIARKVCLSLLGIMVIFGAASLAAGLAALIAAQPYEVYYPLLLIGVLCTILPAVLFRTVKRRYEQKELQKMHAMDIR
jgi:hypothetical protein